MAEASSEQQIKDKWPAYTWALNIPDLRAVLTDPKYTDPNQLQVALQGTNWWKTTSPALRNYYVQGQMDPAGQAQDRQKKEADLWDSYLQLGLKPNVTEVQHLAESALKFGWTNAQANDAMVSHMTYSPEVMDQVGGIQTVANQLKQQAKNYYVGLDDQTAFGWAKSVAAGEHKADDYIPQLQNWAKSKFSYSPTIQNAIGTGISVKDYFAPFQQEAAKMLEVPAASIDFANNPQFSKVLDHVDDKGVRREMTLSESQTYFRGMDQWKSTRQGQQAAADAGEGLLKMFGKVA